MHPNCYVVYNMRSIIFNRYLKICFLLSWGILAESCKSSHQAIIENTVEENTTFEDLDDTTTVITSTVVVSIPTSEGGTKTTTNETKRIINHQSKKVKNDRKVNKDERKIDEITPVLEKEKTKRIKSDNKRIAKVAKEERKATQSYINLPFKKRLVAFLIFAALLYLWIKRKWVRFF